MGELSEYAKELVEDNSLVEAIDILEAETKLQITVMDTVQGSNDPDDKKWLEEQKGILKRNANDIAELRKRNKVLSWQKQ